MFESPLINVEKLYVGHGKNSTNTESKTDQLVIVRLLSDKLKDQTETTPDDVMEV